MISNIMGAAGVLANVLIYQQKNGKNLLLFKLISDFLWVTHYFLLGAYSAVAVAIIAVFREIVFYNQDKKWAKSKLWLVFFLICSVTSAVLTWQSPFSVLPAIASIISVISFWRNDPCLSRYLAFPISVSMLTYDFTCSSYMGIANEVFTLVSAAVGLFRQHIEKNKQVMD